MKFPHLANTVEKQYTKFHSKVLVNDLYIRKEEPMNNTHPKTDLPRSVQREGTRCSHRQILLWVYNYTWPEQESIGWTAECCRCGYC